jgi:DNA repair photolyase
MKTVTVQLKKPATGTQEWAASNVNIQDGCEHDCRYCYAKTMAIRFKRMTARSWSKPRLRKHDVDRQYTKRDGRIMFPTTHDITTANIHNCLSVLRKMLAAGNDVLIVSKPRLECIRSLTTALAQYRGQILFRFSIGSVDNTVLAFWEPGAPTYDERVKCLQFAHAAKFKTSVSCEPMLDADPDALIEAVRAYVTDSIWLGKINRLRGILPLNCPGDAEAVRRGNELIASQNDTAIRALYKRHKQDHMLKWKDSIKAVVGLTRPTSPGMDI